MATHGTCRVAVLAWCIYMYTVRGYSLHVHGQCTCLWLFIARAWSQSMLGAPVGTQFGHALHVHSHGPCSARLYVHSLWLLIARAWSQSMFSAPVRTQFYGYSLRMCGSSPCLAHLCVHILWLLIPREWSQSMPSAPVCTRFVAMCMVAVRAQHACMYTVYGYLVDMHGHSPCSACLRVHSLWPCAWSQFMLSTPVCVRLRLLIACVWTWSMLSALICAQLMATHCMCMITIRARYTCMYTVYGHMHGCGPCSARLYVHKLWLLIARAWSWSMLSALVGTQFVATHCTYMVLVHAWHAYTYIVDGYTLHMHDHSPCSAPPVCTHIRATFLHMHGHSGAQCTYMYITDGSMCMASVPICIHFMATHCMCMVTVHAQHTCMYIVYCYSLHGHVHGAQRAYICIVTVAHRIGRCTVLGPYIYMLQAQCFYTSTVHGCSASGCKCEI